MRDLKWSCSAHAKDIWTSESWEISEKLADCAWAVTCTKANLAHLSAMAPEGRVQLAYHGLDLSRFPPPDGRRAERDGSDRDNPVMILSVGRAVEKKGHDDLLAALARVPENLHWRFEHIGGGPLQARLAETARRLGIAGRCSFHGTQAQDAVRAAYREADFFALMSREASNGDRDGLPNVLMEAQSQGLAVLATRISAIPELIADESNGLLVAPRDVDAAARALVRLITDAPLRARLGAAGQNIVHNNFALEPCIESLAGRFDLAQRAAD